MKRVLITGEAGYIGSRAMGATYPLTVEVSCRVLPGVPTACP